MKLTKFIPVCMILLSPAIAVAQTYSVSGKVSDQTSGNGVQGVTVTIATGATTTDANGNYVVANVPAGPQVIAASSPNFSVDSIAVDVTASMTGQNLLAYSGKMLAVPVLKARKDTKLLCLDGCYRTGDNAWNASRESAANLGIHDTYYCFNAQVAMINRYYGGSITLDECSYKSHERATPEEELGHGADGGAKIHFISASMRSAINYGPMDSLSSRPSESQIKSYIDAGRPIAWIINYDSSNDGHAMVIAGYRYKNGNFEMQFLNTDNNGSVKWLQNGLPSTVFSYAMIPAANSIGRPTDPSVHLDSDGDGVTDFDEKYRWNSTFDLDENKADTDEDGLPDGKDIEGWLFRGQNAPVGKDKSDEDGDGKRGEVDPDSDNGGVMDGDEDADHNANKTGDETDPYAPVSPNSDDIPKVKITLEPSIPVDEEVFVDVTQEVTATFVFYGKNGTSTVPIFDKDAGPLTVTFTPNGGTATTVTLTHTGDIPTESWTGKFTMGNAVPSGKVEFSVKNGSSNVEIIEGKEFYVDVKGGKKNK